MTEDPSDKMDAGLIAKFLDQVDDFIEDAVDKQSRNVSSAARELQELMKKSIESGGPPGEYWPPLSQATLKIRQAKGVKRNTPLLETGVMKDSIEYHEIIDDGSTKKIFVGWRRDPELLRKAAVSIFGTTTEGYMKAAHIPVTEAMRTMMSLEYGIHITQTQIRIPPRPLLRPCARHIHEKYGHEFSATLRFTPEELGIILEQDKYEH